MSLRKSYDLSAVRVLAVGDGKFVRRVVQPILKVLGVGHITTAEAGNEAYDRAQRLEPDIVILDWDMEFGTAPELVRWLRLDEESKCTYVNIIMVTGRAERHLLIEARDLGVNEFLTKPLSAKSVKSRIASVLDNPRPFVRATTGYFGPDRRRRKNPNYKGSERRVTEVVEF